MHLKNMPKVRIQQYEQGFVVEREFKTWYGRKYWKHIISVSGVDYEPWYFSTFDNALNQAETLFTFDLCYYSPKTTVQTNP